MSDEPDKDLLRRAETGDAEAQNELGLFYAAQASLDTAVTWFRRAAEQGVAAAQHNLGVHAIRTGNAPEAAEWFRSAARAGWSSSMFALGVMLEREGELEQAARMYEQAAECGHPDGQDGVARLAFQQDTPEGYEKARHWSEQGAAQGHAGCQARLGSLYHEGLGVTPDPKQAARHWMAAALAGHPGAQLMIGGAYDVGAGVGPDKVEAAYFLALSAAQGSEPAQGHLRKLLRELSPEQRAAAERRLRDAGLTPPGAQ